jgi:CRP-like cAMP-binding protein
MSEKQPKSTSKIKKAPKPTKVQRESRVVEVYKLLLNHETRTEILEFCSKNWGLERAAADNLMQEASRMLSDDLKKTKEANLATYLQSLRNLYRIAMQQGNLQAARQCLMDSAKLLGLDQSTINHVIEDKRELSELSDEDLDKLIAGK